MLTRLNKMMKNDDGFTLVELLIVVLIIGILAAIAIPVYIGIQTQAKHGAVKSDTNITVKRVQVGLTEGAVTIPTTASTTPISGYSDSSARSDGATVVTTPLGNGDFQVQGTGSDGYTYTYSSVTGQFTEGTSGGTAFGGGSGTAPAITSATPTSTAMVGSSYSYTVTATGTPAPTFTATGLPTGLGINLTSGLISGTPTTAGTYNYTIDVGNHVGSDAIQTGTITVSSFTPTVVYNPTFSGSSMPSGWTASGYSNAVSSGYIYTDYNTYNNGNITSPSISLAAGKYTASGLMAQYASGGGSYNAGGVQIVNASTYAVLADSGSSSLGTTRTTTAVTLATTTNVRLVFYFTGGGYTYLGGQIKYPTIQTAP